MNIPLPPVPARPHNLYEHPRWAAFAAQLDAIGIDLPEWVASTDPPEDRRELVRAPAEPTLPAIGSPKDSAGLLKAFNAMTRFLDANREWVVWARWWHEVSEQSGAPRCVTDRVKVGGPAAKAEEDAQQKAEQEKLAAEARSRKRKAEAAAEARVEAKAKGKAKAKAQGEAPTGRAVPAERNPDRW